MANKNQEYTEQYADYAMAQMRRYGIPASVTLAQGILESSNGQSRLAVNENNHFGIKATPDPPFSTDVGSVLHCLLRQLQPGHG